MPMIWHGGALFYIILICILLQDKLQPYCAVAGHWPENHGSTASQSVCTENTTDSLYRVTSGSQVNRSSSHDGFFSF